MTSRVIVISGVSRGLGRAMSEEFIRLGHRVFGCGRSAEAIAELNQRHGPGNRFAVVDVTRDEAVRDWAQECLAVAGPPDLLLNNAALINRNAPLWEVPAAEFSEVIDVNVKGVANLIRHFVPAMVARRSGVIVNFSSGWGRDTDPEVAPYCATKWAMEGLTKALAQELPAGMAAVPINPGIIDTAMLRSCFGGQAQGYPGATQWASSAVPWLLGLGPQDNGRSLTVGEAH
ncbi:MAG: SDR family NAD(P)-dependent oxidoreductase [Sulfuricella sp.]|nr:SDR family NAD(P)-dependent oxidoreductase [Sulfuricella sp.]